MSSTIGSYTYSWPETRRLRRASAGSLKRRLAPSLRDKGDSTRGKDHRLKAGQSILGWTPDVQMLIDGAHSIVGHQQLQLAYRLVFDMLILHPRLLDMGLTGKAYFLI